MQDTITVTMTLDEMELLLDVLQSALGEADDDVEDVIAKAVANYISFDTLYERLCKDFEKVVNDNISEKAELE